MPALHSCSEGVDTVRVDPPVRILHHLTAIERCGRKQHSCGVGVAAGYRPTKPALEVVVPRAPAPAPSAKAAPKKQKAGAAGAPALAPAKAAAKKKETSLLGMAPAPGPAGEQMLLFIPKAKIS